MRDKLITETYDALKEAFPNLHWFLHPTEPSGFIVHATLPGCDVFAHTMMGDEDTDVSDLTSKISEAIRGALSRSSTTPISFDFGQALTALKMGLSVQRSGWNGKGMHLFLVPGSRITVAEGRPLAKHFLVGDEATYLPHIDMKTATGEIVPWLASQTDLLATDWCLVREGK